MAPGKILTVGNGESSTSKKSISLAQTGVGVLRKSGAVRKGLFAKSRGWEVGVSTRTAPE